jgi:hypothetical protein
VRRRRKNVVVNVEAYLDVIITMRMFLCELLFLEMIIPLVISTDTIIDIVFIHNNSRNSV